MRALTTNATINLNKATNISAVYQLLKFKDCVNGIEPKFKKTSEIFRKHGKKIGNVPTEIKNAPIIFVKDGLMWKFSFVTGNYSRSGRFFEVVSYIPIAKVGDKFKELTFDRFNK